MQKPASRVSKDLQGLITTMGARKMTSPNVPQTSAQYRNSLNARARAEAKRVGISSRELLEIHYHRRLLARVFHVDPANWVLKGGQALLVRWPAVRHSTDTDLLSSETSLDEAVASLITAVSADLDDPFDPIKFVHTGTSSVTETDRQTRKIKFEVRFGLKTVYQGVSVDVVVANHPLRDVTSQPLKPPFVSDCKIW